MWPHRIVNDAMRGMSISTAALPPGRSIWDGGAGFWRTPHIRNMAWERDNHLDPHERLCTWKLNGSVPRLEWSANTSSRGRCLSVPNNSALRRALPSLPTLPALPALPATSALHAMPTPCDLHRPSRHYCDPSTEALPRCGREEQSVGMLRAQGSVVLPFPVPEAPAAVASEHDALFEELLLIGERTAASDVRNKKGAGDDILT